MPHSTSPNRSLFDVAELGRAAAGICLRVPVAAGPGALARELQKVSPHLAFREVLERGGWYRLGGVVDAGGRRVADDIEAWAEAQLAAHGDDLQELCDACAGSGLRATRLSGKTHYLVATTGGGAADFIQLEIEELQETAGEPLFGAESAPASLEQLIDPRAGRAGTATPLGAPFHTLRRVTDVADFLGRMRAGKAEPQPVHRFIEAWEKSSAGAASQFGNHWIMALREHLDRHRQPILQATPVAAITGAPPRFDGPFGARGLALHAALQRFDRQAGYPLAWFFHMLTTQAVPHAVAGAVIDDVQAGFHYLPERDVAVVRNWLHRPFAL